ncbi:hypothetical protein P0F65_00070 [Sphingomonas sp. I4]
MAILGRENLPSIANLSKPILRLGGYRIDPATNGQAEVRVQWLNGLSFQDVASGRTVAVRLPQGTRFAAPDWSPDGAHLAFYVQEKDGLALWVADRDGSARPIAKGLNGAFGTPFAWMPDSRSLIARLVSRIKAAPPAESPTPSGPVVQESSGRTSAARTYEDLLGDAHDEALFDYYFSSALAKVDVADGALHPIEGRAVWSDFSVSPDGRYLLTERLKRPYSYLLPARFFPTEIAVQPIAAPGMHNGFVVVDRPLADDLPVDFDATVKGPATWSGAQTPRHIGLGRGAGRRQSEGENRLPRQGHDAGRAFRPACGRTGQDPCPLCGDDVGR